MRTRQPQVSGAPVLNTVNPRVLCLSEGSNIFSVRKQAEIATATVLVLGKPMVPKK